MLGQAAPSSPAAAPNARSSASEPSAAATPAEAEVSDAGEAETIPASESALGRRPGILVFPGSSEDLTDKEAYHGLSSTDENGVLQAAPGPLPPVPTETTVAPVPTPALHEPPVRLDSVRTVTADAEDFEEAEPVMMVTPNKAPPLERCASSLVHCSSFTDASLAARVVKAQ